MLRNAPVRCPTCRSENNSANIHGHLPQSATWALCWRCGDLLEVTFPRSGAVRVVSVDECRMDELSQNDHLMLTIARAAMAENMEVTA